MEIVKKIFKQALCILIPLAIASAFFEWQRTPISILVGGIIALANLKGISWAIEGLIGVTKATAQLLIFSLIRLFITFLALLLLLWSGLANAAGILIGITAVLILLFIQGVKEARNMSQGGHDA